MSLAKELIETVRYKIVDVDEVNFTDEEFLKYLNEGNRLLRRLVTSNNPMMLAEPQAGTTTTDNAYCVLEKKPIKILDVRMGKKPIGFTDISNIDDLTLSGKPKTYFIQGMKTIRWVPTPNAVYTYSILYIPETERLELADDTGWPSDYEDYIGEYINIRAGLRDEGAMTAEMQFMSLFQSDITDLLNGFTPGGSFIRGCY